MHGENTAFFELKDHVILLPKITSFENLCRFNKSDELSKSSIER